MIPKSIPAKLRPHILYWDDERHLGGSIIVTMVGLLLDGPADGDGLRTTHTFGEDTVRDVVKTMRSAMPCHCDVCKAAQ